MSSSPFAIMGNLLGFNHNLYALKNTYANSKNLTNIHSYNYSNYELQKELNQNLYNAYNNLDHGYRQHLAKEGKQINPNRAWTSYYGQAQKYANQIQQIKNSQSGLNENYELQLRNNATSASAYYTGAARDLFSAGDKLTKWL